MVKKWIQKAVKPRKKGIVKNYLLRKYGKKAFTKRGTIKMNYLNKAIRNVKSTIWKKRLVLARTLKRIRK